MRGIEKKAFAQGGFSLPELILSLGLVTVIGLGGAYYLAQSQTSVQKSITQGDLSSHHQRALQRLKSASFVTDSLGLTSTQHQECFSRRRSAGDCQGLSTGWVEASVQFESCPEEGCLAQHQLRFRLQCETKLCSSVDLDLTTSLNPTIGQKRNLTAKPKNSQISIPSLALMSRAQLSFACAQGGQRLITGLNQESLEAECGALQASLDCGRNDPLKHFGDQGECQPMAQERCTQYGFSQLGAFRNQGQCNPGGRDLASVTTTTTTLLPTTTTSISTTTSSTLINTTTTQPPIADGQCWHIYGQVTVLSIGGNTGRNTCWVEATGANHPNGTPIFEPVDVPKAIGELRLEGVFQGVNADLSASKGECESKLSQIQNGAVFVFVPAGDMLPANSTARVDSLQCKSNPPLTPQQVENLKNLNMPVPPNNCPMNFGFLPCGGSIINL